MASKSNEKVSVTVPRGAQNADPNVFIGINGVNYLLPKGQMSSVPPEVAQEYTRSIEAENRFFATADKLKSESKII